MCIRDSLISCGARLAPFDIREVRELMEDDEMELDTIGDEKTVLFLIMKQDIIEILERNKVLAFE